MSEAFKEPVFTSIPFRPEPAAALRRAAPRRVSPWKGFFAGALLSGATMIASAAVILCGWEVVRIASAASVFTVREIRFHGLVHVSEQELLAASGLRAGANLFALDLSAATRRMERNPWVASARLSRRFPGAVDVEIVEHRPRAQVQLGAVYLVDDLGRAFKRAAPGDPADLPLVTGLSRDEWTRDRAAAQLRLYRALQLVDAWRDEGLVPASLGQVRIDDDAGLTAFSREGTSLQEIRFGERDLRMKLRRLVKVRAALAVRGERAVRIDLDNPARPDWASAQLAATTTEAR
ncbi:MAG: cell division protein FtsQ/DivIB [Myxococcales bacterium]